MSAGPMNWPQHGLGAKYIVGLWNTNNTYTQIQV